MTPTPREELVKLWTVEDGSTIGEPPLYNINTGECVLQMVTDDYQMAVDLCDCHNQTADKAYCAYCSAELQKTPEAMGEHAFGCKNHPIHAMLELKNVLRVVYAELDNRYDGLGPAWVAQLMSSLSSRYPWVVNSVESEADSVQKGG